METTAPHVPATAADDASLNQLVGWTTAIYALHAASLVIGLVTTASIIGAFLFGWPSIAAVIVNYLKRSEVRGTWLESHFVWQIRTFWYGLLWIALCALFVVFTLGIGLIVVWIPAIAVAVWFIYRIARGWMRLGARQRMYV